MSKHASTKSKPAPWIPPGKGIPQPKRHSKPVSILKSKKDVCAPADVSPKAQWNTTYLPKNEASKDMDADMMSLSSESSHELEGLNKGNELDIQHISLLREMKLLYMHFASLKTSYLSAHRLIDSQDVENSNVNELFIEAGSFMKRVNALFDDLEYSVSVLENTLNENQKKVEFSTVLGYKEKLLSTLLAMYDKVVLILQVVFEKQDFKELSRLQETLSEKLQVAQRKSLSQEAVITDLERRLSIYQSKTSALESYKTSLESEKVELEKKLFQKESQIKYLNNELLNVSERYTKSDREDFIEIIENIKSEARTDKSALKKALKFLKTQFKEKEETYKELLEETNEKVKMMFDLAAQRDQLKVQLTVVNNNTIQLKQQLEEMKIQNLKLQNEIAEMEAIHKKELIQLRSSIEEKSSELDQTLKQKKKAEEMVVELENKLEKSEESFKVLGDKSEFPKQFHSHTSKEFSISEEIPRLIGVLQSTRETFENVLQSGRFMPDSGDQIVENPEFRSNQKEILLAISEIKKYILELKNQLLLFHGDQKDLTEPKSLLRNNDLEKQFKKMEYLYKSTLKENESLKQKLESSDLAISAAVENYSAADPPSDTYARKFQLELYKKDSEIANLKFELAQKDKDLENHLRESKDKLRSLEIDHGKISSLEDELKNTKLELAVLQRRKEEETVNLLHRAQELQESLDKKTDECKNLEQYIQLIKVSYFKVFDNS